MNRWAGLRYGLMGLPLAMVALPVYLQLPRYYSTALGLPVAALGIWLMMARSWDTLQDLWLGAWLATMAGKGRLNRLRHLAAGLMMGSFVGLWFPPLRGEALLPWFGLMLAMCYSSHSVLNICLLAQGSALPAARQLQAAAWREGCGLLGVILMSLASPWLTATTALSPWVRLAAVLLCALSLLASLYWPAADAALSAPTRTDWRLPWRNPAFRRLLLPCGCNALAGAIAGTLALFFIEDRLALAGSAGWLLGSYFLAGALGMPLWIRLSQRWGALQAWRLSMWLAIAGFLGAMGLQAGQVWIYWLICLLTGLTLGADLMLPPLLIGQQVPATEHHAGYFGLWSLLGKLALAGSALSLPLLALAGYQPGQPGPQALSIAYAGLPCLLKAMALLSLPGKPLRHSAD
ncbi:MFS transporter [Paludibacterium sp. B53371]|uniref:MFS transporter n=1 Tax=Paludibacterium sp. B53371 TaxID=2806263 RepID=UPI001C04CC2A|nr:MFS transporter [Paludibacterium sp. B53371]